MFGFRSLLFALALLAVVGWDNLDYGLPGTNGLIVIEREGYALGFDTNRLNAAWVSYRLTRDEVSPTQAVTRCNRFVEDWMLPRGMVTPDDYAKSGYDRGHLAPAGDMAWSAKAMRESFVMSNMSPQRPEFNRGIWKELESWVRECARTNGSVFVYTGPVWVCDDGTQEKIGGESRWTAVESSDSGDGCAAGWARLVGRIGRNGVAVPCGYYKVVLLEGTNDCLKAIGFLLPNRGSTNSLESFSVPVSEVERATGLDFFSNLPEPMQRNLETRVN